VYKGSPSQLTHIQNPAEIAGIRMNYSIQNFDDLKLAASFIPVNTFVGPHEEVPGVLGGKLPR